MLTALENLTVALLPCIILGIFAPGVRYIQYCNCFSNLLRDVHDSHYCCQQYNVQGTYLIHPLKVSSFLLMLHNYLFGKNAKIVWHLFCTYLLQDWSGQDATSIASELCGFITVLSGTIILHSTREHEQPAAKGTIDICTILGPSICKFTSLGCYV